MTMDEIIERALRQAGIFPPSVLDSHYGDKTEMSRAEIIVKSLEEMRLLSLSEHDPRFAAKVRRIQLVVAKLQLRLPDGEITTCGAFKGLGVGCCDRCHSHPLRRMRLVELPGCNWAWLSAHDDAAHVRVVRLGPEVPRVRGVAVFEGNKMVLLVAGHVVGMRHAAGRFHLADAWVDKLRPCLVDGVPVFPKLLPFQLARVFRRGPYQLRAPPAVADGVLLGDLRICSARSPHRVGVDIGRSDAVRLDRGHTSYHQADSSGKNGKKDSYSHMVVSQGRRRRIPLVGFRCKRPSSGDACPSCIPTPGRTCDACAVRDWKSKPGWV